MSYPTSSRRQGFLKLLFQIVSLAIIYTRSYALDLNSTTLEISEPQFLLDRTCALKFTREAGHADKLSGFLLNENTLISVGHTRYFKENLEILCGALGKDRITTKRKNRIRHPLYDYQDNPKSFDDWAHFDFSVIHIGSNSAVNVTAIPIINDPQLISKYIRENRCIYGGAGNLNENEIRRLRPAFTNAPVQIWKTNSFHIALEYAGPAQVIPGDSGGPLICQNEDGEHVLAGLLEYAGTARNKTTGQAINIVGIMLVRDELTQSLINHFNK